MKTSSSIITAFTLVIAIFGVAQRPGDSAQASYGQQPRQDEQNKKESQARNKQNEDDVSIKVDTTLATVPVIAMEFDGGLRELATMTSDRNVLHDAINSAKTGGGTRLYDMLEFVITNRMNRISGRKAIILFTDGVDVDSRASMEKSLRTVEETGVFIYSIHYKHPQNSNALMSTVALTPAGTSYRGDQKKADYYLRTISRNTGASYSMAQDKKSMTKSFASIAEELRKRYDLGYYPTAPAKPGQRVKIKVSVEKPNVVVRARTSYIYSPRNTHK